MHLQSQIDNDDEVYWTGSQLVMREKEPEKEREGERKRERERERGAVSKINSLVLQLSEICEPVTVSRSYSCRGPGPQTRTKRKS